jgi:hypothetical protein
MEVGLEEVISHLASIQADYGALGNNGIVILGSSLHPGSHKTPERVSGKPHEKSIPETPKRGHLTTTVFAGGNLKISAHQLNFSQYAVDCQKRREDANPDENS